MAISSELGVLSKLPREIRDRIYGFALCLDIESSKNYRPISGAAILRTSQRIYDEAIIVLYQVNTFQIWIDKDYCHPDNISIMETRGFKISFTDHAMYLPPPCNQGIQIPKNMIRHLQKVTILVGAKAGINEIDIVPTTDQSLQGPERPSFRTVLHMVQEACKLLSECDRIHTFHFIAYTNERTPGSLDQIIQPITQLRDIQISDYDISPLVPTRRNTFRLKDSYVDYLDLVLAMPKGTKTPKYRPYEKWVLPEERDSIFTTPASSLNRPWEDADFDMDDIDDIDDIDEAEYGEYGADYLPELPHVFHGCSGMAVLHPGPDPENYTEVGWGGFGNMPLHPGVVRDYMSQIMHSM